MVLRYLSNKHHKLLINVVIQGVTSVKTVTTSLTFLLDGYYCLEAYPGEKGLKFNISFLEVIWHGCCHTHCRNPSKSVQEKVKTWPGSLGSHHQLQQEPCDSGAVINVQASTALREMYLTV